MFIPEHLSWSGNKSGILPAPRTTAAATTICSPATSAATTATAATATADLCSDPHFPSATTSGLWPDAGFFSFLILWMALNSCYSVFLPEWSDATSATCFCCYYWCQSHEELWSSAVAISCEIIRSSCGNRAWEVTSNLLELNIPVQEMFLISLWLLDGFFQFCQVPSPHPQVQSQLQQQQQQVVMQFQQQQQQQQASLQAVPQQIVHTQSLQPSQAQSQPQPVQQVLKITLHFYTLHENNCIVLAVFSEWEESFCSWELYYQSAEFSAAYCTHICLVLGGKKCWSWMPEENCKP